MATAPDRKYALTKIAPGDYLLPSNDARTIWRIGKYEDGPSNGLDLPHDAEFWAAWRWTGNLNGRAVDVDDWSRWEMTVSLCKTRAEAIKEALRVTR